ALAAAREEALRDERIVALGTFAAGVAHEMNTPLGTMSLIAEELAERVCEDDDWRERVEVLRRQVEACRSRLAALVASASADEVGRPKTVTLERFFDQLFSAWRNVRPEIDLRVTRDEPFCDRKIIDERTLAQAVSNLLNNAADASLQNDSREVRVGLTSDGKTLTASIDDDGPGLTVDQLRQTGRVTYTTKPGGLGLGLLLSNASIERFGGQVVLQRREPVGTRAEVHLPLAALAVEEAA
ncbi:MAG: sensor histidine kinase, partial [Proteobacteria bacterium]